MKIVDYSKGETIPRISLDSVDIGLVKRVLREVKTQGDAAIKRFTLKFDQVKLNKITIGPDQLFESFLSLKEEELMTLEQAVANLKKFSIKQLEQAQNFEVEIKPGVLAGQRVIPLDRIGVYVPGGYFPLISSLLMGAIPARVAGVKEIYVCTPPGRDGDVNTAVKAAAYLAGINKLYMVGGIQAIGAMAYGTETIKRVDKIVGPGNRFVTAAKKEVFGQVGIDLIAGPSEIMVLADEKANPHWIAADLLAQAEHDISAIPILVTPSVDLIQGVVSCIESQLPLLKTGEIASQSLQNNGYLVLVESLHQAVEFANLRAPEHLELHLKNAEEYVGLCKNYGSLFIGPFSAEVFGDYISGINHTLPTAGAARYTGGLSVLDFVKRVTTLKVSREGARNVGGDTRRFAELEGLEGHANAVTLRLKEIN